MSVVGVCVCVSAVEKHNYPRCVFAYYEWLLKEYLCFYRAFLSLPSIIVLFIDIYWHLPFKSYF